MKSGFLDRANQLFGEGGIDIKLHMRFFVGEIDHCMDAGQFIQILFDACRTGRAGHAFDGQVNLFKCE